MVAFLEGRRRLAYERLQGAGAGVVFLHGFRSDMGGTKAVALEAACREEGRAFLRLDLSGHGQSQGAVEDFGIGDWLADAEAALAALTEGPQLLVGSSLGGWLALLLARARPDRVAGLVTIAAAPDFTTRMQAGFTEADRRDLAERGAVTRPSGYAEGDYVFSQRLFDQGAAHRVLASALHLPMPVRMLQGTADEDVPMSEALALLAHATGPDLRLVLVKDADHRFSSPDCLALIAASLREVADLARR